MAGIGLQELLIIAALAVVLFGGPALVAFWVGFQMGKKSSTPSADAKTDDEETLDG